MSEQILDFLGQAMKLKTLKRAGWRRCGIEPCESVAEHTFGVALLALLAADAPLDRDRCVAMALVHDLAESIVGDLTPDDPIGPDEKRRREREAMEHLAATLGHRRVIDLWEEFEAGESAEAKLARDLDGIEMAWQARQYERAGKLAAASAARFIESADKRIATAEGRRLLDALIQNRK